MKKFAIGAGIFLVSGLMLAQMSFAGGVALSSYGVRAVSLGGAYRGLSNDWSGAYWNPAGLAQVKGWNVGVSTAFITPTVKLTLAPYEGHRFYGFAEREVKNVPKTFIIPNFGLVYGMKNGLSLGFGVFIPFGLGATWDLYNPVPGFGNQADFPKNDNVSDLAIMDFHGTIAYALNDKFSVGVGFGFVHTKISIEQTVVTKIAALNSTLSPLASAPSDHFPTQQILEGTGTSFSATFGLQFKPTEKLTLGASGRWYSDVSLSGSVKADAYFPSNPNSIATLQALKAQGLIDDATYMQAAMLFSGTKQRVIDDKDVSASVPLPMNLGGGFAFQATEKMLLAFDVEWTQWSTWDEIPINGLTDIQGNKVPAKLVEHWKDGIRYNVGLEYNLINDAAKRLDLRFGYYYDPSPVPDGTITPSIPDANGKHSLNLGFGLKMGKLTINGGVAHFIIPNREVKGWVLDATGGNENYPGLYKTANEEVHIGIGYNF